MNMNPDWIFDKLRALPTTEARIVFTLIIWMGTAIAVWAGRDIGIEFLGAIIAMSGLDAAQYIGKRKTEPLNQESIDSTEERG